MTGAASAAAASATETAQGVKDNVFSMFGGGQKKEKKEDDDDADEPSGSSKKKTADGEVSALPAPDSGLDCRVATTVAACAPRE